MTRIVGLGPADAEGAASCLRAIAHRSFWPIRSFYPHNSRRPIDHWWRACDRKREREHRPAAGTIRRLDFPAVGFDDSAADRKAQADPAMSGATRGAEEFFE